MGLPQNDLQLLAPCLVWRRPVGVILLQDLRSTLMVDTGFEDLRAAYKRKGDMLCNCLARVSKHSSQGLVRCCQLRLSLRNDDMHIPKCPGMMCLLIVPFQRWSHCHAPKTPPGEENSKTCRAAIKEGVKTSVVGACGQRCQGCTSASSMIRFSSSRISCATKPSFLIMVSFL